MSNSGDASSCLASGLNWLLLDTPGAPGGPPVASGRCMRGHAELHGVLAAHGPPALVAPGVPRNYHLASATDLGQSVERLPYVQSQLEAFQAAGHAHGGGVPHDLLVELLNDDLDSAAASGSRGGGGQRLAAVALAPGLDMVVSTSGQIGERVSVTLLNTISTNKKQQQQQQSGRAHMPAAAHAHTSAELSLGKEVQQLAVRVQSHAHATTSSGGRDGGGGNRERGSGGGGRHSHATTSSGGGGGGDSGGGGGRSRDRGSGGGSVWIAARCNYVVHVLRATSGAWRGEPHWSNWALEWLGSAWCPPSSVGTALATAHTAWCPGLPELCLTLEDGSVHVIAASACEGADAGLIEAPLALAPVQVLPSWRERRAHAAAAATVAHDAARGGGLGRAGGQTGPRRGGRLLDPELTGSPTAVYDAHPRYLFVAQGGALLRVTIGGGGGGSGGHDHHSSLLQELPPGEAFAALVSGGDAACLSQQLVAGGGCGGCESGMCESSGCGPGGCVSCASVNPSALHLLAASTTRRLLLVDGRRPYAPLLHWPHQQRGRGGAPTLLALAFEPCGGDAGSGGAAAARGQGQGQQQMQHSQQQQQQQTQHARGAGVQSQPPIQGGGPNSTTLSGRVLYASASEGSVRCLEFEIGAPAYTLRMGPVHATAGETQVDTQGDLVQQPLQIVASAGTGGSRGGGGGLPRWDGGGGGSNAAAAAAAAAATAAADAAAAGFSARRLSPAVARALAGAAAERASRQLPGTIQPSGAGAGMDHPLASAVLTSDGGMHAGAGPSQPGLAWLAAPAHPSHAPAPGAVAWSPRTFAPVSALGLPTLASPSLRSSLPPACAARLGMERAWLYAPQQVRPVWNVLFFLLLGQGFQI
ncbi:hypothetical protein FOA52_014095 [Chlamydomonas sp. UWO 241]|nr:hypothetical protein FOA52_014095 [Chlamydomonas sp. UWO 241]